MAKEELNLLAKLIGTSSDSNSESKSEQNRRDTFKLNIFGESKELVSVTKKQLGKYNQSGLIHSLNHSTVVANAQRFVGLSKICPQNEGH